MAIYPLLPSPADSSDLPESRRAALCFLFGLASDGVYICPVCYQPGGSLLRCLSTLTGSKAPAVYFCCTVPGVASARRYLASCPVKPGLSSPAAFRHMQLRPFVLLGKLKASLPHFSRFVYGGEKIRSKCTGKTFQ